MKADERRAIAAISAAALSLADIARWHREQAARAAAYARDERQVADEMSSKWHKETGQRIAREWDGVAAFHTRAAELIGG